MQNFVKIGNSLKAVNQIQKIDVVPFGNYYRLRMFFLDGSHDYWEFRDENDAELALMQVQAALVRAGCMVVDVEVP